MTPLCMEMSVTLVSNNTMQGDSTLMSTPLCSEISYWRPNDTTTQGEPRYCPTPLCTKMSLMLVASTTMHEDVTDVGVQHHYARRCH